MMMIKQETLNDNWIFNLFFFVYNYRMTEKKIFFFFLTDNCENDNIHHTVLDLGDIK